MPQGIARNIFPLQRSSLGRMWVTGSALRTVLSCDRSNLRELFKVSLILNIWFSTLGVTRTPSVKGSHRLRTSQFASWNNEYRCSWEWSRVVLRSIVGLGSQLRTRKYQDYQIEYSGDRKTRARNCGVHFHMAKGLYLDVLSSIISGTLDFI